MEIQIVFDMIFGAITLAAEFGDQLHLCPKEVQMFCGLKFG
jgi:hypothetical protein